MTPSKAMSRPRGTLTDAGPLFALVDPHEQPDQHSRCVGVYFGLRKPLVTTWPCFAEAMYLSGRKKNVQRQKLLWEYVTDGVLEIVPPKPAHVVRMQELMEKYDDLPMDLADASLVALAEAEGFTEIFSIDSDFYSYQMANGEYLVMEPGPLPKK